MSREALPTWFFVVVIVRRGDKFLLVQERKHGQLWFYPAGRVEPGESFVEAARRETMEEAGIPIQLQGILGIEHSPAMDRVRMRVVFVAKPADDTPPKSVPDDESLAADWFSLEEAEKLPLRGPEVLAALRHVSGEHSVHPLSLLRREGDPF